MVISRITEHISHDIHLLHVVNKLNLNCGCQQWQPDHKNMVDGEIWFPAATAAVKP